MNGLNQGIGQASDAVANGGSNLLSKFMPATSQQAGLPAGANGIPNQTAATTSPNMQSPSLPFNNPLQGQVPAMSLPNVAGAPTGFVAPGASAVSPLSGYAAPVSSPINSLTANAPTPATAVTTAAKSIDLPMYAKVGSMYDPGFPSSPRISAGASPGATQYNAPLPSPGMTPGATSAPPVSSLPKAAVGIAASTPITNPLHHPVPTAGSGAVLGQPIPGQSIAGFALPSSQVAAAQPANASAATYSPSVSATAQNPGGFLPPQSQQTVAASAAYQNPYQAAVPTSAGFSTYAISTFGSTECCSASASAAGGCSSTSSAELCARWILSGLFARM